ncbi:MAG: hypothetical protein COB17_06585 [Sulfurimonas sp.]|nr:MAG: hypothetical protein COB17_06585 [Sulfurimonas sp.]
MINIQPHTTISISVPTTTVDEAGEEIEKVNTLIANLKTIPGVADKTIAALLSERGDLSRFPSISKFIGYLGFFPTENSSGNSKHIGHLSKRGSDCSIS